MELSFPSRNSTKGRKEGGKKPCKGFFEHPLKFITFGEDTTRNLIKFYRIL